MSEQFSRILDDRPDMPDDSDLAVMVDAYQELSEQNQAGWETAEENRKRWEALLAVARATVELSETVYGPADSDLAMAKLDEALDALDAAHPGWREWTP